MQINPVANRHEARKNSPGALLPVRSFNTPTA